MDKRGTVRNFLLLILLTTFILPIVTAQNAAYPTGIFCGEEEIKFDSNMKSLYHIGETFDACYINIEGTEIGSPGSQVVSVLVFENTPLTFVAQTDLEQVLFNNQLVDASEDSVFWFEEAGVGVIEIRENEEITIDGVPVEAVGAPGEIRFWDRFYSDGYRITQMILPSEFTQITVSGERSVIVNEYELAFIPENDEVSVVTFEDDFLYVQMNLALPQRCEGATTLEITPVDSNNEFIDSTSLEPLPIVTSVGCNSVVELKNKDLEASDDYLEVTAGSKSTELTIGTFSDPLKTETFMLPEQSTFILQRKSGEEFSGGVTFGQDSGTEAFNVCGENYQYELSPPFFGKGTQVDFTLNVADDICLIDYCGFFPSGESSSPYVITCGGLHPLFHADEFEFFNYQEEVFLGYLPKPGEIIDVFVSSRDADGFEIGLFDELEIVNENTYLIDSLWLSRNPGGSIIHPSSSESLISVDGDFITVTVSGGTVSSAGSASIETFPAFKLADDGANEYEIYYAANSFNQRHSEILGIDCCLSARDPLFSNSLTDTEITLRGCIQKTQRVDDTGLTLLESSSFRCPIEKIPLEPLEDEILASISFKTVCENNEICTENEECMSNICVPRTSAPVVTISSADGQRHVTEAESRYPTTFLQDKARRSSIISAILLF